MSLTSIIQTAYSGLAASQTVMRSISNNISNVNTPGYHRENAVIENLAYNGTSAGVGISEIMRIADQFLEDAVYSANSDAEKFGKLNEFHDRLQDLLGSPSSETGLSGRLDKVFESITQATIDPSNINRRQALLSAITQFTDELNQSALGIQQLRSEASNQIQETVGTINSLLSQLHGLNPKIVREKTLGNDTAGLEEQQGQALERLSKLLDIKILPSQDGSIRVSTKGGVILVDQFLTQLDYKAPGTSTADINFPAIQAFPVDPITKAKAGTATNIDGLLQSGKLKGLLDIRDQDLPTIADNIGELARVFTEQVNAIHNANTAVPAPNIFEGKQTGLLSTDLAKFSGKSTIAIADPSGTVLARHVIDFGALGPGATIADVVVDINAGLGGSATASFVNGQFKIQATAPANGIVIADDAATPSNRNGRGFSYVFGLNDLITSSQQAEFETGVSGPEAHGFTVGQTLKIQLKDINNRAITEETITIAGANFNDILSSLNSPTGLGRFATFSLDSVGKLVTTPNPGYRDLRIQILDDSTERGATGVSLSKFFGIGQGAIAGIAENLSIRKDIEINPFNLGFAKFDSATAVGAKAYGLGDQRGASALRDLGNKVLKFTVAGVSAQVSANFSGYAGLLLGEAARHAEAADNSEKDAIALQQSVAKRRDDYSGVNLDEELGNMIVFQNSYNAAARLMNTARDMYDTLISIVQ